MSRDELKTTREMFLRHAIERILGDRDIRKKEHSQLKRACEQALGQSLPSLLAWKDESCRAIGWRVAIARDVRDECVALA